MKTKILIENEVIMAGHSKWNNIKRRKNAVDAQRGRIFTKLGRAIHVAVKHGGPDPASNAQLADAIAKAKASNMPNDNIMRSIAKASGAGDADNFEDILYEGYGPGGVAVLVRTLTDNRNRTAGDVRHIFDKYGGNLGTNGCVSFLFEDKGTLIINRDDFPDEEQVMLDALEAGADDFETEDEIYQIITSPDAFRNVRETLELGGYTFEDVSLDSVPMSWTRLDDPEQAEQMEKLIDMLEDHDDVQDVSTNWESDD